MPKPIVFIIPAYIIATIAIVLLLSGDASALNAAQEGANAAHGNDQPATLFGGDGSIITSITNTLLFLAGALAVIMIIIGGFRYVVSGGNSSNVTAAKNTILYALVGLVVAFLAFAAVNFIVEGFAPGGAINSVDV